MGPINPVLAIGYCLNQKVHALPDTADCKSVHFPGDAGKSSFAKLSPSVVGLGVGASIPSGMLPGGVATAVIGGVACAVLGTSNTARSHPYSESARY